MSERIGVEVVARRPFSPEFGQRVTVDRTSLTMADDLTFDQWVALGRQLTEVGDSMAWWVGDWIVQGGKRYHETYEQALALVPLKKQTLENYAWMARTYESSRRRELSWTHHEAVAAFEPEAADIWLELAEEHAWSVRELRERIRAEVTDDRPAASADATRVTLERLTLTVPEDRAERWKTAADRAGVSFEEWCSATLDAAAGRT